MSASKMAADRREEELLREFERKLKFLQSLPRISAGKLAADHLEADLNPQIWSLFGDRSTGPATRPVTRLVNDFW